LRSNRCSHAVPRDYPQPSAAMAPTPEQGEPVKVGDDPVKVTSTICPPAGLSPKSTSGTAIPQHVEKPFSKTVLVKPAGAKLGIVVVPVTVSNLCGLYVKDVLPDSVIDAHNRACSEDEMICPGDCIVRVDGLPDAAQMMQQLSESGEHRVTLLKQVEAKNYDIQFPKVVNADVSPKLEGPMAASDGVEPAKDVPNDPSESEASTPADNSSDPSLTRTPSGSLSCGSTEAAVSPPPGLEKYVPSDKKAASPSSFTKASPSTEARKGGSMRQALNKHAAPWTGNPYAKGWWPQAVWASWPTHGMPMNSYMNTYDDVPCLD